MTEQDKVALLLSKIPTLTLEILVDSIKYEQLKKLSLSTLELALKRKKEEEFERERESINRERERINPHYFRR